MILFCDWDILFLKQSVEVIFWFFRIWVNKFTKDFVWTCSKVEVILNFNIENAEIGRFCNFSHLSIKSCTSFPPIFDWFFFENNLRIVIYKFLDFWQTMIKTEHVYFSDQHRIDQRNVVNMISQWINYWKRVL